MFKHILVPVDGSATSMQAVGKAAGLAKAFGSEVTAVYVLDPYPYKVHLPTLHNQLLAILLIPTFLGRTRPLQNDHGEREIPYPDLIFSYLSYPILLL